MLSINIGIFIYVGLIVITIRLTKKIFFVPLFNYFSKKEHQEDEKQKSLNAKRQELELIIYQQTEIIKKYHLLWRDTLKQKACIESDKGSEKFCETDLVEKITFYQPSENQVKAAIKKVCDEF